MIDVAIGMALVFLALAAACSFFQEAIASLFSLRGRMLERALRGMLEPGHVDPRERMRHTLRDRFGNLLFDALSGLLPRGGARRPVDILFSHPYATSLRGLGWFGGHYRVTPSCLPTEIFVRAMKDMSRDPDIGLSLKAETLLRAFDEEEKATPGSLEKNLTLWFETTMDRASGWYQRQVRFMLAIIATVLVVAFNVDAVAITRYLWTNGAARESLVNSAVLVVQDKDGKPRVLGPGDTANTQGTVQSDALTAVMNAGLPLGFGSWCEHLPEEERPKEGWLWAPASILHSAADHSLGWFFAILAGALGAPFWYDVLSKLVRLRTGKGSDESTTAKGSSSRGSGHA